jgi:hypothetical protein
MEKKMDIHQARSFKYLWLVFGRFKNPLRQKGLMPFWRFFFLIGGSLTF